MESIPTTFDQNIIYSISFFSKSSKQKFLSTHSTWPIKCVWKEFPPFLTKIAFYFISFFFQKQQKIPKKILSQLGIRFIFSKNTVYWPIKDTIYFFKDTICFHLRYNKYMQMDTMVK